MLEAGDSKWQDWKGFNSQLFWRIRKPVQHPQFMFYFVSVILLIGGLGVWITLYKQFSGDISNLGAVSGSLSTYALPILTVAFGDLILEKKTFDSILIFALLLFLVGILCAVLGLVTTSTSWCVVSVLIALFLWWIVNADKPMLTEPTPPATAPTGGDVQQGLMGHTTGLRV